MGEKLLCTSNACVHLKKAALLKGQTYITCIKLDDKRLYAKYIGHKTRGSPEPESLNWTNLYLKMTTVPSIMASDWGPAPNYALMVKI